MSWPTKSTWGPVISQKGDKELAHFINISLGSLAETKYLLYFANRLEYLGGTEYRQMNNGFEKLGQKLWKFYETVRHEN